MAASAVRQPRRSQGSLGRLGDVPEVVEPEDHGVKSLANRSPGSNQGANKNTGGSKGGNRKELFRLPSIKEQRKPSSLSLTKPRATSFNDSE